MSRIKKLFLNSLNNNMTRTSGWCWTSRGDINIELLKKNYSTRISLALPFDLSCDVCSPQMEAAIRLTKKEVASKKRSRYFKSGCWIYHQLW